MCLKILDELGELSDEKAVVRMTTSRGITGKPCRPESGSSQNKDQAIEAAKSSQESETLSQELERNEYMMNRLKLYNKYRGKEIKSSAKQSSSADLSGRQPVPNNTNKKMLMQSESEVTDELKSKATKSVGFSIDANEIVRMIDDQITEELVSKDPSVSDKSHQANQTKPLPTFDDAVDPRMMAFAPTLPIHAFRQVREESSQQSSLHQAQIAQNPESSVSESPEVIFIDTSSKKKMMPEPMKQLTPKLQSKWNLGFVSHSETAKASESQKEEDAEMVEDSLLARLQIGSQRNKKEMSLSQRREQELESVRLAQQLAREEFERDKQMEMEEQKTIELIKSLEVEEQNELKKLRDEQEEEEMNEFNCKICIEQFEDENGIFPLQLCEHIFHRDCLGEYLRLQIKEAKVPIICPDPKCKHEISDTDLKDLLDDEQYNKYSSFAFNQAVENQKDISWCPTADCRFAFVFNPEEQKNDSEFNCPTCKKHYCLNCRVDYHAGQTCMEYQVSNNVGASDKAFLKFVKGKKYKQCPHCNFWVERTQGCDHMSCRCGKHFCYKCGGVYGQCECVREAQARMREHQERIQRMREEQRQRMLQRRRERAEERKRETERKRLEKQQQKELEEKKRKNPKTKEAAEFAKPPAASTRARAAVAVPEPPAKRKRTQ